MPTIALVGAGRGLGAAIARRFATEGFDIALLSRSQDNADALAAALGTDGHTARGYAADVRQPVALARALETAEGQLGPIEVLTYSPIPQPEFLKPILETTSEDLSAALEFSVGGPTAAVGQVLGGMRARGSGSILAVNGGSAVRPSASVAGTSVAFAAESAFVQMLHESLAPEGIHAAQLIVPGAITVGHPTHDPDVLADKIWQMHAGRGEWRVFAAPMDSD